jgi:hypothetical protein
MALLEVFVLLLLPPLPLPLPHLLRWLLIPSAPHAQCRTAFRSTWTASCSACRGLTQQAAPWCMYYLPDMCRGRTWTRCASWMPHPCPLHHRCMPTPYSPLHAGSADCRHVSIHTHITTTCSASGCDWLLSRPPSPLQSAQPVYPHVSTRVPPPRHAPPCITPHGVTVAHYCCRSAPP